MVYGHLLCRDAQTQASLGCFPTAQSYLANRIAPELISIYLARAGYEGQLTDEPLEPDAPGNLFEPVAGDDGVHGRFDSRFEGRQLVMFTNRHRNAFWALTQDRPGLRGATGE